jgi:hypothetical protein
MRRLSALLLLLLCAISVNAQTSQVSEEPAETQKEVKAPSLGNNIAYLEIGGVCAYYSANFQHNFRLSDRVDLGAGVGLSMVPKFGTAQDFDYSPRLGRHEIGAGAVLCLYTYHFLKKSWQEEHYQDLRGVLGAQLGYSYTTKSNIYFGAYLTPMFMDSDDFDFSRSDFEFTFFGGVRVGYRFR